MDFEGSFVCHVLMSLSIHYPGSYIWEQAFFCFFNCYLKILYNIFWSYSFPSLNPSKVLPTNSNFCSFFSLSKTNQNQRQKIKTKKQNPIRQKLPKRNNKNHTHKKDMEFCQNTVWEWSQVRAILNTWGKSPRKQVPCDVSFFKNMEFFLTVTMPFPGVAGRNEFTLDYSL